MPKYSNERKQAILKKLAPPHNMTVAEVAVEENISSATLYNWRKTARQNGVVMPSNTPNPDSWSSEEKFKVVITTYAMSAAELSEYCRQHGLFPETVEAWRQACIDGNDLADGQKERSRLSQQLDKKRIKKLEAELRRKNDALAETAALLALSKKLEAFWGEKEDN